MYELRYHSRAEPPKLYGPHALGIEQRVKGKTAGDAALVDKVDQA